MRSVFNKINGITISVDYRTELLGIIMWISDYTKKLPHLFNHYGNEFYINEILDKFSKYSDDNIVLKFNELVDKHEFGYDVPYCLFLQLDEHFKCDKLDDYILKDILENDSSIYDFINNLESFALKIGFDEFYESHIMLYNKWVNSMSKLFEMYDIPKFCEDYFGYKSNKDFIVNLMPFTTDGSFACTFDKKIYDCFPVYKSMDELFCFKDYKYVLAAPVHEFLHSFVNPVTEKLFVDTNLFDNIRDIMASQAYEIDDYIMNEHLVRALTIRFYNNVIKDDNLVNSFINCEKDLGFIYIEPILEKLKEYEDNRDKYTTFDMFYPEIVEFIKGYNKSL